MRAAMLLDLLGDTNFIATIVILLIVSVRLLVPDLAHGLATCDMTVDQPLDELGDVFVLEPPQQLGIVR